MESLKNYSDLEETLEKNNKIIFLCGTGVSCSLSGKLVTWGDWLKKELDYVSPSDRVVVKDVLKPCTAQSMIKAAGILINRTKNSGNYTSWMNYSFESLKVKDVKLGRTLSNIIMSGDILATTNYDMLLDQATGLTPLTYHNPNKILSLLRNESEQKIVHIHGAYSNKIGLDDIVADEKQYNLLINDLGAQFIQNLTGTHTIIFIGCGATMEDVNLSRFINFASKYLNLKIPYYYLCQTGDVIDKLSKHIVPIEYGETFGELPLFLNEMIQYRLNHRSSSKIICLSPYKISQEVAQGIGKYYFDNTFAEFVGRSKELSQLNKFLSVKVKVLWWGITGLAGIGKSRLVLEWMRQLSNKWYAFFVDYCAEIEDVDKFIPFNNTVVAVDYVLANEKKVSKIIKRFILEFEKTEYQLRIVFIERDSKAEYGSWYYRLMETYSDYDRQKFENFSYEAFMVRSNASVKVEKFLLLKST